LFQLSAPTCALSANERERQIPIHCSEESACIVNPCNKIENTSAANESIVDEVELFKYRAQIFKYDNDLKQWKERGVGDMKIIKHPEQLIYRVLMRRDQTLKNACNHLISDKMELKPLSTSETALWCSAVDYAD